MLNKFLSSYPFKGSIYFQCIYFYNFFLGKNHINLSNQRYTPDPHQTHVDIIRPTQTPTRQRGKIVIALHNYQAHDVNDVSFRKGDRMEIIDDSDGDWWTVLHLTSGDKGLIPGNFVASEQSVESEE